MAERTKGETKRTGAGPAGPSAPGGVGGWESPFSGASFGGAENGGPVGLLERPFFGKILLRGLATDAAFLRATESALGTALPLEPNTTAALGGPFGVGKGKEKKGGGGGGGRVGRAGRGRNHFVVGPVGVADLDDGAGGCFVGAGRRLGGDSFGGGGCVGLLRDFAAVRRFGAGGVGARLPFGFGRFGFRAGFVRAESFPRGGDFAALRGRRADLRCSGSVELCGVSAPLFVRGRVPVRGGADLIRPGRRGPDRVSDKVNCHRGIFLTRR